MIIDFSCLNFLEREFIRKNWGNPNLIRPLNVVMFFVIGIPQNRTVQNRLDSEQIMYQDLIQGNYTDSYKNLSFKGISWLRYSAFHCGKAKYVLKVDEDVIFDPRSLVEFLRKGDSELERSRNGTILCKIWENYPTMRNSSAKGCFPYYFVPASVLEGPSTGRNRKPLKT